MTRTGNSFYIRNEGPNPSAITRGLNWLCDIAKQNPEMKRALFAVNTLGTLGSVVTEAFGAGAVEFLKKGNGAKLCNLINIELITLGRHNDTFAGPVLAYAPNKKLLDKIDDMCRVTDVLVIPFRMEEVQFWISTWSANEYGSTGDMKPELEIDRVLVNALKSLTSRVNLTTGIGHPNDRDAAISLFRILRQNNVPLNPDSIRAWLVGQGNWSPEHADEVADIVRGVNAGKRFRCKSGGWESDIFKLWSER